MSELTPNQVYDIIFPRSIREEVDEFKENVLKEMRENDLQTITQDTAEI